MTRRSYGGRDGTTTAELELRVVTFPAREYSQRRLGSVRRDDRYGQSSAVMDLGEAVQTAVERGLPLLLSTEAAGHLADTVRVGRMKGRPGALTITSSDGLSATTRRVVAEQAISRAARAQPERREGHIRRRCQTAGADDTRPAARRRSGAARPPAGDRRAQGRRIWRRRQPGRQREDDHVRSGARKPRVDDPPTAGDDRRRGPAARPVARRAHARRPRPRAAAAGTERARGGGR